MFFFTWVICEKQHLVVSSDCKMADKEFPRVLKLNLTPIDLESRAFLSINLPGEKTTDALFFYWVRNTSVASLNLQWFSNACRKEVIYLSKHSNGVRVALGTQEKESSKDKKLRPSLFNLRVIPSSFMPPWYSWRWVHAFLKSDGLREGELEGYYSSC